MMQTERFKSERQKKQMEFERKMWNQQVQPQMPQTPAMGMGEMRMVQQLMQQHNILHNQLASNLNPQPQAQPGIHSLLNLNPNVQLQETKSRTIVIIFQGF